MVFLGESRHSESIGPPFRKSIFKKKTKKNLEIFGQNVRINSDAFWHFVDVCQKKDCRV